MLMAQPGFQFPRLRHKAGQAGLQFASLLREVVQRALRRGNFLFNTLELVGGVRALVPGFGNAFL